MQNLLTQQERLLEANLRYRRWERRLTCCFYLNLSVAFVIFLYGKAPWTLPVIGVLTALTLLCLGMSLWADIVLDRAEWAARRAIDRTTRELEVVDEGDLEERDSGEISPVEVDSRKDGLS